MSALLSSAPAMAKGKTGIGFVAGGPTGLTIKSGNFPVIEVGWNLLGWGSIDLNVDYWLINKKLASPIDWYLGVGAAVRFTGFDGNAKNDAFGAGVRVPIGLQWFATPEVELFIEAAPTMSLLPSSNFGIDGAFGIRFYIF